MLAVRLSQFKILIVRLMLTRLERHRAGGMKVLQIKCLVKLSGEAWMKRELRME